MTRYIVRVGYSLMEDEGRLPAVLAVFNTLDEAQAFADAELNKHGRAWGATTITREESLV